MNEAKDPRIYDITRNVLTKSKIGGLDKRNIAEAIISAALAAAVIFIIPFTTIVKGMSCAVICSALIVFNLRGIKNRSVSQIVIAEINFRKNRRKTHIRGPEYKWQKGGMYSYDEDGTKSAFEKGWEFIKGHINGYIEKYSDPDNSEYAEKCNE